MVEKYHNQQIQIPQDKRADINEKILSIVHTGKTQGITQEDIFNSYTGIGGLHGLNRKDFDNYHAFSNAKKDIEHGQFFTPHSICKEIAELIEPKPEDLISDVTCGIGNFFNYFTEENCYGCELDAKAVKIAQYLYPGANIVCEDFRYYKPQNKVDYVLGNPPFNLSLKHPKTGDSIQSQVFFFEKSAEILKPAGVLIAIVPTSFMNDEFFQKYQIHYIQEDFDFIGQYKLSDDAFKQMGVSKFETKVMAWQKKSEAIDGNEYKADEFVTYEELKQKIQECIEVKNEARLKLHRELIQSENSEFEYKVRKYLYEIKTHKKLHKYLDKALQYVEKFKTQTCPDNMDYETWVKKHKISETMVLSYLKRTVQKQNLDPKDEIRYVKTRHGVKLKAYSNKTQRQLKKRKETYWGFNHTTIELSTLQNLGIPLQYRRLFDRKKEAYTLQNTPFSELDRSPEISNYLRRFSFLDKDRNRCYFNKIQRFDLGLLLQKNYSILAWQMGGGKTAGAYAWSKWKEQKNTFVVSASLAITLTWTPFLKINNERFVVIKNSSDFEKIRPGDYVLLSFYYITKYEKQLKKFIKTRSQKVNLIFDESDEITNNRAKRTRSVLNIFRRVKRKFLTTGTTTRNNIGELYSQLELLYNNSVNMISWSPFYYVEERTKEGTDIKRKDNKYWREPFPPYVGQTMFRRCFNPSKSTVFGIQKQNQDIYNEDDLRGIIEKTIITRKFREIAGDKYEVENIRVHQDPSEREVYRTIVKDLDKILPDFFNSTGNSRKDTLLRAMRQLNLLIEATSTPQMFDFYNGTGTPNKAKKIFDLTDSLKEKVAIGCTSIKGTDWYYDELVDRFPDRQIFKVVGDVSFKRRKSILKEFEATEDGILVCTQQSLKSSVNIPTCDKVIVESLQWNIPKIEQFYFRFIRYNSKNRTKVFFVNYEGTIEVNLLALLMAKERLNDYVKTLEYKENSDIYDEYDIDLDILNNLITKQKDKDGNVQISWGEAKAVN